MEPLTKVYLSYCYIIFEELKLMSITLIMFAISFIVVLLEYFATQYQVF